MMSACGDGHCITCSDEATSMRVLAVDDAHGLAVCAGGDGAPVTVEIALVAPVSAGDQLLVHAGTALARLRNVA